MKHWQSLFLCEGDQVIEAAKIVEEVGFDGALVSDHLLHLEHQESTYLYSEDGKPPSFSEETVWPECWSLMATLAAVTEKIKFATNVFILPLRNPIEVAKATGSVAFFGNDRIVLGVGAGWMKEEFDALGVDFKTRGKRYDECIEVIRKLHSGKMVEHHGEFFDFPRVQMTPAPRKPVPIYIGGTSNPALRRTVRLGDGWLGPGQPLADALATTELITSMLKEAGRANDPFDMVVPIYGEVTKDDLKRLEDAGATSTVSLPFAFTVAPNSSLEQKRAYMEGYANHFIA
ncbi:MAG: TIGR03619 family F420-dependent LLM class oxidoreductase [Deltaproteobacteria bacterium]|nr:TIGR03619 family F420-dependent LLM class oxidoreductase [Deltaproteobacteria bacterium]